MYRHTALATQRVAENGRLLSTHCVPARSLDSNTAPTQAAAVIFHFTRAQRQHSQAALKYDRLVSVLETSEAAITAACNNNDFHGDQGSRLCKCEAV